MKATALPLVLAIPWFLVHSDVLSLHRTFILPGQTDCPETVSQNKGHPKSQSVRGGPLPLATALCYSSCGLVPIPSSHATLQVGEPAVSN